MQAATHSTGSKVHGLRKTGQKERPVPHKPTPDFSIEGEGRFCSVYLLRPLTPAAFEWIAEHIPDDASRLGNAVAVGHSYIGPIAEGILADNLVVA